MMPDGPYPWEPVLVSLSRRGRKRGPCISLWPWLWTDPNDRYPIHFAPFPLVLLWRNGNRSRVRPTLTWKCQKGKVSYRPKCVDGGWVFWPVLFSLSRASWCTRYFFRQPLDFFPDVSFCTWAWTLSQMWRSFLDHVPDVTLNNLSQMYGSKRPTLPDVMLQFCPRCIVQNRPVPDVCSKK